MQLEDRGFQTNKTSLDLIQQLRDLDQLMKDTIKKLNEDHKVEVDSLQAYITDLKARLAVYIPVKTDAIDVALAQYMNNYPDKRKIKIQFIRQGQGVYLFGTQLVNIKSERGSVQIKIGGGYQPIGEFLDQNTGKELEKFECKDPL